MKILWVSFYNSFSGYANQARLVVPRLKQLGHEVTVFNLGSTIYPISDMDGVPIVHASMDTFGNNLLVSHFKATGADVVITLNDLWAFRSEILERVPVYPWIPIDHSPPPSKVLIPLKSCKRPIAISKFGVKNLSLYNHKPLFVPHGYDPQVFPPNPDRAAARKALNVPENVFWVTFVGINDSNPSRKGIPELLMAWESFSKQHQDAVLYLHTSPTGGLIDNPIGGVNIPKIVQTLQINERQIVIADEYRYAAGLLPQQYLAAMYAASDVVILPSRGEGFGLPLIEAQAMGTPVITTRFGAQEELCASGWLIEGESAWSPHESFYLNPSIQSIYQQLETAYDCSDMESKRKEAVSFAEQYQIDRVMETYWRVALSVIENDLKKTPLG